MVHDDFCCPLSLLLSSYYGANEGEVSFPALQQEDMAQQLESLRTRLTAGSTLIANKVHLKFIGSVCGKKCAQKEFPRPANKLPTGLTQGNHTNTRYNVKVPFTQTRM